jgi:hypothetical protein
MDDGGGNGCPPKKGFAGVGDFQKFPQNMYLGSNPQNLTVAKS